MKVLAMIFDGFEELEATAPFAVLRGGGSELRRLWQPFVPHLPS